MKSLSEIETVSKRSTKAAGFSWGIAEEVGKNTRMLEMFGLSGIKNLNYYFQIRNNKKFEKLNLVSNENKTMKLEFCPIIAGLSFLDQVRSLESFKEINFENIGYPLLFLPFISRASEVIGKRLLLKLDSKQFILNFNNSIFSNFMQSDVIEVADTVSIKFIDNSDSFLKEEWRELYKLSEQTFVEESDSSKKRAAGAGLTDND